MSQQAQTQQLDSYHLNVTETIIGNTYVNYFELKWLLGKNVSGGFVIINFFYSISAPYFNTQTMKTMKVFVVVVFFVLTKSNTLVLFHTFCMNDCQWKE